MENTEKVLFENDQPQWYVAVGESWLGPLSASDINKKVQNQELTWAHFAWKTGQADWKRLCDIKAFQIAVPEAPTKDIRTQIKEISKPIVKQSPRRNEEKIWYLYYNDTQFGPFSRDEVARFLRIGKIHGRVHCWKNGFDTWDRIQNVDVFKDALTDTKKILREAGLPPPMRHERAERKEKRKAPRQPLVAKIVMAHGEKVSFAVCRDISVGGMQVLTDRSPGAVGSHVKLNVSSSGRKARFEPFVAEGTIVRVLEDGRGFSFRFDKLSDSARRSIENYVSSAA